MVRVKTRWEFQTCSCGDLKSKFEPRDKAAVDSSTIHTGHTVETLHWLYTRSRFMFVGVEF